MVPGPICVMLWQSYEPIIVLLLKQNVTPFVRAVYLKIVFIDVYLKAPGVAADREVEDGVSSSSSCSICSSLGELQHTPQTSSSLSSHLLFQHAVPSSLFTALQAVEL